MADSFDPYYTWLGIPPEEQPADHYRLLGVRRFESNTEVIVNAADQRMVYVRTFQTGKRMKESQRLLNEISAAQLCLVDPEKKRVYDDQLHQKLAGGNGSQPAAVAPPGGNGAQAHAAAKSGIRSPSPLRTAAPLMPQAAPQAPLTPIPVPATPIPVPATPIPVPATPTPLQPIVVPLPGAHATAAQAQPVPIPVDPLQSFTAVGPRPAKPIEKPAGLTMPLAILIGGGSFLTGALVLVSVIVWAATRPAPTIVRSPNPVQPATTEPLPEETLPESPAPAESAQGANSPSGSSSQEETPAPMPTVPSVAESTPAEPAPASSSSSPAPPMPIAANGRGPLVRLVPGIAEPGRKLTFSSSGKLLAACDSSDNRCNLILLEANKSMSNHARALVFSPDESRFAVLWPDHTDLFQTDSLGRVALVHGKPAQAAAFSGDGRLLALASPGEQTVMVYDVERGAMLDPITTELQEVAWLGTYEDTLVCWSPDKKAETIPLRDPAMRRKLDKELDYPPIALTRSGQTPTMFVLNRVHDTRLSIYRWSLESGQPYSESHLEKFGSPSDLLAVSPDGALLVLLREGALAIVRTLGDKELTRIDFPGDQIHAAALTGEQGLLAFNGPGNSALIADMRQLLAQPSWQIVLHAGRPTLQPVDTETPPSTTSSESRLRQPPSISSLTQRLLSIRVNLRRLRPDLSPTFWRNEYRTGVFPR